MLPRPPVVCRSMRRRSPSMANRTHIPKRFPPVWHHNPLPLAKAMKPICSTCFRAILLGIVGLHGMGVGGLAHHFAVESDDLRLKTNVRGGPLSAHPYFAVESDDLRLKTNVRGGPLSA